MMTFLKTTLACGVLLGVFDFIWLGLIAKSFNNQQLQAVARMNHGDVQPQKFPALITYILMALAISIFVSPQTRPGTPLQILGWGALLGFFIYGIFDLTNLSIIKDYPGRFAVVDVLWGTALFGLVSGSLALLSGWLQ